MGDRRERICGTGNLPVHSPLERQAHELVAHATIDYAYVGLDSARRASWICLSQPIEETAIEARHAIRISRRVIVELLRFPVPMSSPTHRRIGRTADDGSAFD